MLDTEHVTDSTQTLTETHKNNIMKQNALYHIWKQTQKLHLMHINKTMQDKNTTKDMSIIFKI